MTSSVVVLEAKKPLKTIATTNQHVKVIVSITVSGGVRKQLLAKVIHNLQTTRGLLKIKAS